MRTLNPLRDCRMPRSYPVLRREWDGDYSDIVGSVRKHGHLEMADVIPADADNGIVLTRKLQGASQARRNTEVKYAAREMIRGFAERLRVERAQRDAEERERAAGKVWREQQKRRRDEAFRSSQIIGVGDTFRVMDPHDPFHGLVLKCEAILDDHPAGYAGQFLVFSHDGRRYAAVPERCCRTDKKRGA